MGGWVRLGVLGASGAVIGFCGSGVPHIPQKRFSAGFLCPQLEQSTGLPQLRLILNYAMLLRNG